MQLKVSSAKWQPFCLDLNVLKRGYNQYFAVMLLLEEEIPSNFTICVNYMLYRIAEFTDNKTLTGRILIEIAARFHTGILKIPGFHYKSIVHLSMKNNISYKNSTYMSSYEIDTEYSRIQINNLSNSFQVCGITIYLVIQSTEYLQFFYTEFWKLIKQEWKWLLETKAVSCSWSVVVKRQSNNKSNQYIPLQRSWAGNKIRCQLSPLCDNIGEYCDNIGQYWDFKQ